MLRKLCLLTIGALFVGLVGHRVWRYSAYSAQMPAPVDASRERELHFLPGGIYTLADIEANGWTSPAKKYQGFQPSHDFNPGFGERLCPITRTKANPTCTWTIAGREYEFCCPPCIDEFVRLAKDRPGQIRLPDAYVKQ